MKSEDKVQEGRRAEGIWEKKVWGARIKALEDALVSKSDELRVTKESVDTVSYTHLTLPTILRV